MSAVKYDLIVIGSGPAGQRAAVAAAKMNKRVAVVEARTVVGGVCINTGTIPSKTMREAVLHLSGYNYRSIYGINYRVKEKITMADLAFRVQAVIKTEVDVTEAQLSRNGIDVVHGIAHFVDPHQVRVEGPQTETTLEADRIIIAVGTKPAYFAQGADQRQNHRQQRSDSRPCRAAPIADRRRRRRHRRRIHLHVRRSRRPRHAHRKARPTARVRRPRNHRGAQLPPPRRRVTMRLGEEVESVEELPHGTVVANLESKKKVSGDALLYAVGRQGNVDELNLAAAGLEADNRGRIAVDEHYQTKVEHIYAVGDVVGFPSLASVSMEQGRIAAARAFNDQAATSNPSFYPYGIYTIPEISFIGKTEEQLTDEDVPYEVGMAYYREIARGQIRGDTTGRLKLIFHRDTRKVLGVHIIGEGATELVHIGQAVMTLGGTVDYFIDTVFNYPTLAECYKVAAFNGLGRLNRYQSG